MCTSDVKVRPARKAGQKVYALEGKLFFGSALRFHNFFDVDNDPSDVVLELTERPIEYSAVDALSRVSALYAAQQKTLTIEILGAEEEGQAAGPAAVELNTTPAQSNMVTVDPQ